MEAGEVILVVASAGLGSVFSILFPLSEQVATCTYDPSNDARYLFRIVLGLVAGIILAALIPVEQIAGLEELTQPLLALLGGFSASTVYRILQQLVSALEAAFQGDPKERLQQELRLASAKAEASKQARDLRLVDLLSKARVLAEQEEAISVVKQLEEIRRHLEQ